MEQPKKQLAKKTVKVTSTKDPRYKAYNDSLSLYNQNTKLLGDVRKDPTRYLNQLNAVDNSNNTKTTIVSNTVNDDFNEINTNIKPVGYQILSKTVKNPISDTNIKSTIAVPKYKKPQQVVEVSSDIQSTPIKKVISTPIKNPIIKPLQSSLESVDINIDRKFVTPPIRNLSTIAKPKSYKITEESENPYGLDNRIEGTNKVTYEVSNPDNISTQEMTGKNKRTIVPQYANGGEIDPPTTRKTIEQDNRFLENWYKNRVIPDPVLNAQYQAEKPLYVNEARKTTPVTFTNRIDDDNTQGEYNRTTKGISLLNTAAPEVYTHEKSHAINLPLQGTQTSMNAFNLVRENILPQDKVTDEWVKKNYKDIGQYNEIIPRLNTYRQLNEFKPNQVITPEVIKANREAYNKGSVPFEDNTDQLYKLFKDEELSNVLNKVVSNNTKRDITVAAYGGNINSNNTNMKYARLPKNKRHIAPSALVGGVGAAASMIPGIGTAVGAGLGMVSGLLAKDEEQRAADEARRKMEREQAALVFGQKNATDALALQDYNTTGTTGVEYYANGGELDLPSTTGKYNATGGNLVPLSSNMEIAEGNTHGEKTIDGQYGITLDNGSEPIAEIEDQEVIVDGERVFSDRLMFNNKQSFADKAKQIAKKTGKLEDKLNSTNDIKDRNGYERSLAGMKMAEDVLFTSQEARKEEEGLKELQALNSNPVMAYGGGLSREDRGSDKKPYPTVASSDFAGGNRSYPIPTKEDAIDALRLAGLHNRSDVRAKVLAKYPSIHKYAKGGKLPKDGTEGTISNEDFAKSLGRFNPSSTSQDFGRDPSFLEDLAPNLIDNLVNASLTRNTPEVPKPVLNPFVDLQTEVNVNPQLAAIAETTESITDNILGNTSSSNVARANIASAKLKGMNAKLGVLGQKENLENTLRNQQVSMTASNTASNNALLNQYTANQFQRDVDKQSRVSGNFANLSQDINNTFDRRGQTEYYDKVLLADLLDDKTGEKIRTANRNPSLFKSARLKKAIANESSRKANIPKYNWNDISTPN